MLSGLGCFSFSRQQSNICKDHLCLHLSLIRSLSVLLKTGVDFSIRYSITTGPQPQDGNQYPIQNMYVTIMYGS